MKNLHTFLGIIIVCFGILSGCKTLFDVVPTKGIYSPIDFRKEEIALSLDYVSIFSGASIEEKKVYYTVVNFTVKDTSLNYGVTVFNDSLAASIFIRRNIISNLAITTKATLASKQTKKLPEATMTAKVEINPSLGPFQYIVPFAFDKRDSSKTYNAQGYIQAKIGRWTRFASIPSPAAGEEATIFQEDTTLSCMKYNTDYNPNLNLYTYNTSTKKWNNNGSISRKIPINYFVAGKDAFREISRIHSIFFDNNKYYVLSSLLSGYSTVTNALSILSYKKNSDITKIFTLDGSKDFSNDFDQFSSVSYSNLTQGLLQICYKPTVNSKFLSVASYSTPISSLTTSLNSNTSNLPPGFDYPSIFLYINNKLIVNNKTTQNVFAFLKNINYKLDINKITDQITIPNFTGSLTGNPEGLICLSDGLQGYVIGKNQVVYKVTLNASDTPSFVSIYKDWFPVNGPASITQSIMYRGQIALLFNNYEVWLFDPAQKNIDFSLPGAVTIVPINTL